MLTFWQYDKAKQMASLKIGPNEVVQMQISHHDPTFISVLGVPC